MSKILKAFIFAISATFAITQMAEESVLSVDFSKSTKAIHNKAKGSFNGVLPEGFSADFPGWNESVASSSLVTEDAKTFLRLNVEKLEQSVQFAIPLKNLQVPGSYRLTVYTRPTSSSLSIGIRQIPSPYKTLWNGGIKSSRDWTEKSFTFNLENKSDSPTGIFLYPGTGITDIASLKLVKLSKEEIEATIERPDKSLHNFFRNTRFPLGLQSGWNIGRDFTKGSFGSDETNPGPSGAPSLKIQSETGISLYTEPFQTSDPAVKNQISFACKGSGEWQVVLLQNGKEAFKKKISLGDSWKTESFEFMPNPQAKAFCLRFIGKGTLFLDSLQAYAGSEKRDYQSAGECEVALAPADSEISETRIQFEEESPVIKYSVTGKIENCILKSQVTNLYGECKQLPDKSLGQSFLSRLLSSEKEILPSSSGTLDFAVFKDSPYGQFRIEAWVERDGKRISPFNEILITRIKRPIYWGKDAPNSPFGSHFLSSPLTIKIMKAGGVNWARLHDAGLEYIGWWKLEPEKGKWTFYDDDIFRYRENNIKIFAQFGTAPPWATHFNELGLKNVGYFEKFLRPKKNEDFANYVKVVSARYKGVIDEYFVWNEPWGSWWKSGADSKFYTERSPEADYAELSKVAYNAAKAVDPSIKISGFNGSSGQSKWTKGVYDAGALNYCDIVDYHFYTAKETAFPGDSAQGAYNDSVGYIKEKSPSFKKPVYMSEGQGASSGAEGDSPISHSGLYKHSLTWTAENDSINLSDMNCRYVISVLAQNVSKVFLYSAHCYNTLSATPNFLVLLGADGYPHPSLAAHSNMAWNLENKKFIKIIPLTKNVFAYMFEGSNGSTAIISGMQGGVYSIPKSGDITVTDLFGNPLHDKAELHGTLIYVNSKLKADALTGILLSK